MRTGAARAIVLVPYSTRIEDPCERALRAIEELGVEVLRFRSFAAIDRARSDAATAALDRGFDELIWVDPDIAFEPHDIERLRSHNLSIVAGLCPNRGEEGYSVQFDDGTTVVRMGPPGGLRPTRYVGAGFLFTKRVVYSDIQRSFSLPACDTRFSKRTVPYFLPMVIKDGGPYLYLRDDYAFCQRARDSGHDPKVDTTILLDRIATYSDN